MPELDTFLNLVDTLGTLGLLVWLVVAFRSDLKTEQINHENTRREYREDLRDIANLRVQNKQAD